jgi:hypothetical protein
MSPATGRGDPRGSGQVKAPDFLNVQYYEGGGSSTLDTGRLYPTRNTWYSFLETKSNLGHMVTSVATEKIPSDTTGNRSQDRPTSSACLNHYATPDPIRACSTCYNNTNSYILPTMYQFHTILKTKISCP